MSGSAAILKGIGVGLSFLRFVIQQASGGDPSKRALKELKKAETINNYLEWLRRKNHQELKDEIEEVQASTADLLAQARQLGVDLETLSSEIVTASEDLREDLTLLQESIVRPVLSPFSPGTRPQHGNQLKGRDAKVEEVRDSQDDVILYGQPGSGKTALLEHIAGASEARFAVSSDSDEVVHAVKLESPTAVIIDDAGSREDLLDRLSHLRREHDLSFRIIAVCWPFDREVVSTHLQHRNCVEIELGKLPRPIIAEIIKEIAAARGIRVSDDFIRVAASQSRGMPGLAASITTSTLDSNPAMLVSGELLLKDLAPVLINAAGNDALEILAAFAVAGEAGIDYSSVGAALEIRTLDIRRHVERIVHAGVLEQIAQDRMRVQPEFLRSALLVRTFFSARSTTLPEDIFHRLSGTPGVSVSSVREMIFAKYRAGGDISESELREAIEAGNTKALWEIYAQTSAENCRWVVSKVEKYSESIIGSALQFTPDEILPEILIAIDSELQDPTSTRIDALSTLKTWVYGTTKDSVRNREYLLQAVSDWVLNSGNPVVAGNVLKLVLSLKISFTESDASNPMTMTFTDGHLKDSTAEEVFAFWPQVVQLLEAMDTIPWNSVLEIVFDWNRTGKFGRTKPDATFDQFIAVTTETMVASLVPLIGDNQAVARSLRLFTERNEFDGPKIEVDPDFMILFPAEDYEEGYEQRFAKSQSAARQLGINWVEKPVEEVSSTLSEWEDQLIALGNRDDNSMLGEFAREWAAHQEISAEPLLTILSTFPTAAAGAIIDDDRCLKVLKKMDPELLSKIEGIRGRLISVALDGRVQGLMPVLAPHFSERLGLIECMVLRGEVTERNLEILLKSDDEQVKTITALYLRRSKHGIPPAVANLWREVIVDSLVDFILHGRLDTKFHDIKELIREEPSVAFETLDRVLAADMPILSYRGEEQLGHLVSAMTKEQRRELLARCDHLSSFSLPAKLVSRDGELFDILLANPEIRSGYVEVLSGNPLAEGWSELARIALAAGISPTDISRAASYVIDRVATWGDDSKSYWEDWFQNFEQLSQYEDPAIAKIGAEGMKWTKEMAEQPRAPFSQEYYD
ncbi:MAG: hypothetical protein ACPGFB_11125 [Verrucomicrobiales bacterium]